MCFQFWSVLHLSHLIRVHEHKLQLCFSLFHSFLFSLLFSTTFLYSVFIVPTLPGFIYIFAFCFLQSFLRKLGHKFHISSEPLNPQCSSKEKIATWVVYCMALPALLCFSKCKLGITWSWLEKKESIYIMLFGSHICACTLYRNLFHLYFLVWILSGDQRSVFQSLFSSCTSSYERKGAFSSQIQQ